MTLQTSGTISLANVQTEFGGSNPISMNEYYAGGSYVPSGTTGTNGAVPTSGTISMSQFYGTTDVVITIDNASVGYTSGGLVSSTSGYRLTSGGQIEENEQGSYTNIGQWITPTSQAGNYEVYATLNSGSLSSGTTGSWLALSTSREWSCFAAAGDIQQATITIEIRRTGTSTVLDTATINITADAQL